MLHHMCQTEREFKDGMVLSLMKRCASCYLTMYNERKGEEGKSKSGESDDFESAKSQPTRTPSPVIEVPTLPPIDNLLTLSPTATDTVQDTTNNVPPKDRNEEDEGGSTDGNEGGPSNESESNKSVPPDTNNIVPTSVPITPQPLRGKQLPKVIIPDHSETFVPELKVQKGFAKCSVVVCPSIFLYHDVSTKDKLLENFTEKCGPYAYGQITQVPNRKKSITDYIIKYDTTKDMVDGLEDYNQLCTSIPGIGSIKSLLKRGVERANIIDYRFNGNKHRGRRATASVGSELATGTVPGQVVGDNSTGGSTLLSGILCEIRNTTTNDNVNEEEEGVTADSESDEGSTCDMETSAFVNREDDEEERLQTENIIEDEVEDDFMSDEWNWNNWVDLGDNDEINGLPETDHYNGPHGLKPGVANQFSTVLQCIFATTAMNKEFFKRLASQSNNYARRDMIQKNSTLYLGHKWKNITCAEMIRFLGIMLRISLEPRKMGGYASYFQDSPVVAMGGMYSVELRGYQPWARDVMPLIRFKQIRSAFHPESGTSYCGDKCHQLRFFIRMFNDKAKHVFNLGPNVSFDEGGVAMRSRYCPVRQYNKDKPEKFRVDFFIMADAKHYFIYHLDVYQGKNKANIDIDPTLHNLPTTQKAVANAIVKSGIANDINGSRHIFMDNRYAAPQLFALMQTNYNVRGVGTCKANRKGFDSKALEIDNKSDRGTFKRMVDDRLGMVITRWKDSRTLQVVSTVMKKGIGEVTRRTGPNLITVTCPNDIIMYQQNMDGVDRGDQHRVMGAGFANVAHFKKWYKKAFLGVCDFSFLQAFTAWNLATNSEDRNRRGGVVNHRELKKWEFYSVAAEEMMTYAEYEDDASEQQAHVQGTSHIPVPVPKNYHLKVPTCMICSMEEGIMRGVMNYKHSKGRHYSRRKQHLAVCSSANCNIVCHTCCPKESKIRFLPQFATLSCFEIAHHNLCNNLFVEVRRKGKTYTRSIKNHSVCTMVKDIYKGELPRRGERNRRGRPARNLPSITDVVRNDDDNMTNISMITTPASPELLVTPAQQEQRRPRLSNTTTTAGARMTTTARKTRPSVANTTTTVRTTRQAVRKLQRTRNTTRKRSRR